MHWSLVVVVFIVRENLLCYANPHSLFFFFSFVTSAKKENSHCISR